MKMTKPATYESMSQRERQEFIRHWMLVNCQNIELSYKQMFPSGGVLVEAIDPQTKEVICQFQDTKDDAASFEVLANKDFREAFSVKVIAKPGDKAYLINPVFSDETQNFVMFMHKERIIEVTIERVSGANDLEVILNAVDSDGNNYGVVQEAFFTDYEDAVEACKLTPVEGYADWDAYMLAVKHLTTYNYVLEMEVQRGDNFVILDKYSISIEPESAIPDGMSANDIIHTVRANRIVFQSVGKEHVQIDVQATPWLEYSYKSDWVTECDAEVIVDVDKFGAYKDTLNGAQVYAVSCSHRVTNGKFVRVTPNDVLVTAKEIRRLRNIITAKQKQLMDGMTQADNSDDASTYRCLKEMQLQCAAELRLLYYLEHNQGDLNKFIVC